MKLNLFLFILLVFPLTVLAKKFSTEYVNFDLLNNWHCYPEGTDWICTNKLNRRKASEAIIILTAKQKGPMDNFELYLKHLKTPRTLSSSAKGKKPVRSKIYHAKTRQINNHQWVDGFHENSEVPSYYTRYLVTIKGGLAILVTYSAHKNHYKKYAMDFANSINSLRVMNVKGLSVGKGPMGVGSAQNYIQGMIDAEKELSGEEQFLNDEDSGLTGALKSPKTMGFLLLVLALLAYLVLRKKRKKLSSSSQVEHSHSRRRSHRRRSSRH